MLLKRGDKLVMIGDSITDAGRPRPLGEGRADAWGRGYVALVNALLQAAYPELGIRVINQGCSGNTVRDLKARWQEDVIRLQPDWLSIMIGINDVWRQFDSPRMPECHVLPAEYEQVFDELLAAAKGAVKRRIVVMAPYMLEPNRKDPMRAMMDRYGRVCRTLATRHGCLFVESQAAFDRVMKHVHPMTLAWDRIHPDLPGHMVIARSFLDAVGFSWT